MITWDATGLRVYAHTFAAARAWLQALAVPYEMARDVQTAGDAVLWRKTTVHPGTVAHFSGLGQTRDGRALLPEYAILSDWQINGPVPIFAAQAEYQLPPSEPD